jgi:origin recognition complex subunit 5
VREAANVSDEEQTRLETPSTDESVGDDVASPREGERELSKCGLHDKLAATLHGRKDKVLLLTSLLGEAGCPGYPFLFIYGNSGMGKTVVVRTVINAMKIPHAYIDCREFFTMRALLESIMDGFSGHTLLADNSYASIEQVDNVAVFVRKFKTLLCSEKFSNQTVCIVFDNAQKLGSFEANLLPALSRLHELCHDNRICVVLISCLTWERVRGTANCFDPIPIHFPNYSKDETITILSRHRPVGSPESFYRSFVSQLWSVVGQVCQDINELRHLAIMLYAKYREPVESGEGEVYCV